MVVGNPPSRNYPLQLWIDFPKRGPMQKTPKPEGNDCCVCAPFVSVGDCILMIPKTLCKVQLLKTAFNQRVLTSNFPRKTELDSLDNLDLHPPWTSYSLLKKHLVRGRQISLFTAQVLLLGLQRPPSLKVLGPMSSLKNLQGWKFTPAKLMEYDPKPPFLVKLPGRVPMFVLGIVLNTG